ncbi:MAG: hypothetical protein ABSH39_16125 [Candidatus Acidiferrum sp.]
MNLLAARHTAQGARFSLQLRDLRLDNNCFRNLADLEANIQRVGFGDDDLNVWDGDGAETTLGDFDE